MEVLGRPNDSQMLLFISVGPFLSFGPNDKGNIFDTYYKIFKIDDEL